MARADEENDDSDSPTTDLMKQVTADQSTISQGFLAFFLSFVMGFITMAKVIYRPKTSTTIVWANKPESKWCILYFFKYSYFVCV